MKGFLSILALVLMTIMLLRTQHCRCEAGEADSLDRTINTQINTTTSYGCIGSIHDCIAPEADILVDHTFRRMLGAGSTLSVLSSLKKSAPVLRTNAAGYGSSTKPGACYPYLRVCHRQG